MGSVCKVLLLGRIGKDPELKQVKDSYVCNFSMATTESYKDKSGNRVDQTEWHNIQFWG
ncbi:single-stranded DNA-binding protein, partial [Pantoea ananatis]|uniref:single-stranded DNA-binding protein n=1 Tax=Pantoea ananas TaxID=553 RepID=UPI00396A8C1F